MSAVGFELNFFFFFQDHCYLGEKRVCARYMYSIFLVFILCVLETSAECVCGFLFFPLPTVLWLKLMCALSLLACKQKRELGIRASISWRKTEKSHCSLIWARWNPCSSYARSVDPSVRNHTLDKHKGTWHTWALLVEFVFFSFPLKIIATWAFNNLSS